MKLPLTEITARPYAIFLMRKKRRLYSRSIKFSTSIKAKVRTNFIFPTGRIAQENISTNATGKVDQIDEQIF